MVANQPGFQPHPTPQSHWPPNYNQSYAYSKPNPSAPSHQVIPSSTPPTMVRPSQHQMAQHLMNPQTHMRSQRLMQQQQQHQMAHQREEQMMTCDPLDCFTNRKLALRRYTNNHMNMNSLLGTHWTINQLLQQEHIRLVSKPSDSLSSDSDSIQQRKDRLKQKINEIERDLKASEISYQAQLDRIQSA